MVLYNEDPMLKVLYVVLQSDTIQVQQHVSMPVPSFILQVNTQDIRTQENTHMLSCHNII